MPPACPGGLDAILTAHVLHNPAGGHSCARRGQSRCSAGPPDHPECLPDITTTPNRELRHRTLSATFEAWREKTGHTILERYGMTETNMNTSSSAS